MENRALIRSVAGTTIGCVIDALEVVGVDAEALSKRLVDTVGPDPVEAKSITTAWNVVYPEHVEPFIALFAGEHIPFGTYEIIDYLASSCETVGRGIECLGRYFGLIYEQVVFDVTTHAQIEFRHPRDAFEVFFDEYTTGVVLSRFSHRAGHRIEPTAIRFRRAAPSAAMHERLTRYLGCEPTYGAEHTRFSLSDEDWAAPLPKANKRLELRLIEVANEMLADQKSGVYASTVRSAIVDGLRDGDATIVAVASRLATTARTLQRRLKEEGTSFQDELEAMRRQLADRYLKDRRLSIAEVAFLLGYSEASAFARAFRRWTGASPQRHRAPRA